MRTAAFCLGDKRENGVELTAADELHLPAFRQFTQAMDDVTKAMVEQQLGEDAAYVDGEPRRWVIPDHPEQRPI